jgi:flavin-dependent dehydrogenase
MPATLTLTDAARQTWDALVVGAGPAGSVAARQLAMLGARVLLVDRSSFPRWKVCGCCLLPRALTSLAKIGLGNLTERLGAVPLTSVQLWIRNRHAVIAGPGGVALSREALDAALLEAAITAGAEFLPETLAHFHLDQPEQRVVQLQQVHQPAVVSARVVVAADGLSGSLTSADADLNAKIAPAARIGAGCSFHSETTDYPAGTVFMACGRTGYVGLVRLEDGRLNIAAALDRSSLRGSNLATVAARMLAESGLAVPIELETAAWRGTPPLTRKLIHPWARRVFVIGDAAGYLEPFTGEGIAWALASGIALAPLARQAVDHWDTAIGRAWEVRDQRLVRQRQRFLRSAAFVLRHPWLARRIVATLTHLPALARPFMRHLNRPNPVLT